MLIKTQMNDGSFMMLDERIGTLNNGDFYTIIDGEMIRGKLSKVESALGIKKKKKPSNKSHNWVAKFTPDMSTYGSNALIKGESFEVHLDGWCNRSKAMIEARDWWREHHGGPYGVKAKISVRIRKSYED
ncbi:hypothetical protein ASwh1_66 [Aeromonas phage Aswh_1]|nr:hypothetical protein ASwh1_66 [Aeromonas phage Aswh_1]